VVDGDYVADRPAGESRFDRLGVRRVAQDVGDADQHAMALGRRHDLFGLGLARSHRLLQQHRQPTAEKGQSGGGVLAIRGGDHDGVDVEIRPSAQPGPVRPAPDGFAPEVMPRDPVPTMASRSGPDRFMKSCNHQLGTWAGF
jgi:hypothetical protein